MRLNSFQSPLTMTIQNERKKIPNPKYFRNDDDDGDDEEEEEKNAQAKVLVGSRMMVEFRKKRRSIEEKIF